jgi:hypothetical protein
MFGILCALSRIYIGVHFPYDVVIGGLIGFFITHGVFYYAEKKYKHSTRPEYRYNKLLISLTGFTAAVFYLFFNNDYYAPLSKFINSVALMFSMFFVYNIISSFFEIYKTRSATKRE